MLKCLTNIIGLALSDKRRILNHHPQKDRKGGDKKWLQQEEHLWLRMYFIEAE